MGFVSRLHAWSEALDRRVEASIVKGSTDELSPEQRKALADIDRRRRSRRDTQDRWVSSTLGASPRDYPELYHDVARAVGAEALPVTDVERMGDLIEELTRWHPTRVRRILSDMRWLRRQAKKRGYS